MWVLVIGRWWKLVRGEMVNFFRDYTRSMLVDDLTIHGEAMERKLTLFFGEKEITDGESVVLNRIVQYHFAEKHLGE